MVKQIKITKFQAKDGTTFDTKEAAEEYERKYPLLILEKEFRQAIEDGENKIRQQIAQAEWEFEQKFNEIAKIADEYGVPFEYTESKRIRYRPPSLDSKFGDLGEDTIRSILREDGLILPYSSGWHFSESCY